MRRNFLVQLIMGSGKRRGKREFEDEMEARRLTKARATQVLPCSRAISFWRNSLFTLGSGHFKHWDRARRIHKSTHFALNFKKERNKK